MRRRIEDFESLLFLDATLARGKHVVLQLCPACGVEHDCVAPMPFTNEARERPGDITICLNCLSLLLFLPDMTKRVISEAEQAGWDREKQQVYWGTVRAVQRAKALAKSRKRDPPDARGLGGKPN